MNYEEFQEMLISVVYYSKQYACAWSEHGPRYYETWSIAGAAGNYIYLDWEWEEGTERIYCPTELLFRAIQDGKAEEWLEDERLKAKCAREIAKKHENARIAKKKKYEQKGKMEDWWLDSRSTL